jgi:hypothetical protein
MEKHDSALPTTELVPRIAPYAFNGQFYEACDCFTVCPCWTGGAPDDDECTGVFAWAIDKGSIDGVDVSGRRVASVSTHTGHREQAKQGVLIFVDEDASPEAAKVLAEAVTGLLGGPLGELARLLGKLIAVEYAEIRLDTDGHQTSLSVGRKIVVAGSSLTAPDGRVTTLSDARLSDVLGSPSEVGVTRRFRVALPGHGLDVDLRGRSSMRGAFSYTHRPDKRP